EARSRLVELDKPKELLDERVALAGLVRLERDLDADGSRPVERGGIVQIAEGMNHGVEADPSLLQIVAALDGTLTLDDVIAAAAGDLGLSGGDAKRLRREALTLARELLELGAARFL